MHCNTRALRQQRSADGAEARDRPRGDAREDPAGLRLARQRLPDQHVLSAIFGRHRAAQIRPGQGASSTTRSPGHSGPIAAAGPPMSPSPARSMPPLLYQQSAAKAGITHRGQARAGRRLLGRGLEQAALLRLLLGRAADPGRDVFHRLLSRRRTGTTRASCARTSTRCCLQARAELDEAKRKAIYRDMAVMVRDEGGLILPMFNDFIDATGPQGRGLGASIRIRRC